jgi:separase
MVECGEFEPYGVPHNYLYAGSAAVVGTLWDVTDKDIDRFAMEAFVNWGLLGRDHVKEDSTDRRRKMKARGRAKKLNTYLHGRSTEAASRREVDLGESVAKARDACLLRYLNGAAPVVYGIPVYLDR